MNRGSAIFLKNRWDLTFVHWNAECLIFIWAGIRSRTNRHIHMTTSAPWVMFRPEIKVLDCTVRDGGLINSHRFEDQFVKAVYDTCIESGIDYMELGYKASKKFTGIP